MQRIQNKAARIITGTRLIEHKTNSIVNAEAKLENIRTYLDRQARNIWGNTEINEATASKIEIWGREKARYLSSRKKATQQQ